MDILESYKESRDALIEISRNVFKLLCENDRFGMIKSRGIIRLNVCVDAYVPEKVIVEFYSAKDEVSLFSIRFDRQSILNHVESEIIATWLIESISLIEKHNTFICKRFLKDFSVSDHKPILSLIGNYGKMNDKSDNEIAVIVAKHITKLYLDGLKNEQSTT